MQATAVAVEGRALILEGRPGVGKSSLALALIDRGAVLIGDDGVTLHKGLGKAGSALLAAPPPNIEGLIEVRGVGLVRTPVSNPVPVGLILTLLGTGDPDGERLPEQARKREILGCGVPVLPFRPGEIAPCERARHALKHHGLE